MHFSVMKQECIENLNIKDNGIYIDGTIGLAGHSSEILKRIPNGFLYGFDQDEFAVNMSNEKLSEIGTNYKIIRDNFSKSSIYEWLTLSYHDTYIIFANIAENRIALATISITLITCIS